MAFQATVNTHTTLKALWTWYSGVTMSLDMIAVAYGFDATHPGSPKLLTHRRGSLLGKALVPSRTDTRFTRVLRLKEADVKSGSPIEEADVGDIETGHACESSRNGQG